MKNIVKFIKQLFSSNENEPTNKGIPEICPHCKRETEWLSGPTGGMCINLKCHHENCGKKINYAVPPLDFWEVI